MVRKYRKKPVTIEAIQWNRDNLKDVVDFVGENNSRSLPIPEDFLGQMQIRTLEGIITASLGDFIIKGIQGEFYPCKPDIFAATYEPVPDLLTTREILMEDISNASWAMERVEAGKDTIWQNKAVWYLAKAVKDILLYLIKKEKGKNDDN